MWERSTHVVAKKSAIIFNTSVSLLVVSSNPGVSMSTTRLPSSMNSSASLTSSVHDLRSIPTGRFEQLARLMNWIALIRRSDAPKSCVNHTDVFPLPVAPMTL